MALMNTDLMVMPGAPAPQLGPLDDTLATMQTSGLMNPADWFVEHIGGTQANSGVRINGWTVLTSGAVYQAVTTKAGDLAAMPIDIIRNAAKTDRKVHNRAWQLMNQKAHMEICSFEFRETMQIYLELHGNAIASIERDSVGSPVGLNPLVPYSTTLERHDGELWYIHIDQNGGRHPMRPENVFHLSGMGCGVWGFDKLQMMRETVGNMLAAQEYRGAQWGNTETPALVVTKTDGARWDTDGQKEFRRQWKERHQGVRNAGRIATLHGKYAFHPVTGITQQQAQLVEQMDKDVAATARFFNMPLYKLGILEHSSSRANLEQQNQDYLQSSLLHPMVKWQQEIEAKLISKRDQTRRTFAVRYNTRSLLRADTAARFAAYALAVQWGWMSVNDVRRAEDLDEIDGGDFYLRPMNMAVFGPDAEKVLEIMKLSVSAVPPSADAETLPAQDEGEAAAEQQAGMFRMLRTMAVEQIQNLQESEKVELPRLKGMKTEVWLGKHRRRFYDRLAPLTKLPIFGNGSDAALKAAIDNYITNAKKADPETRSYQSEAVVFVEQMTKGAQNE